MIHATVKLHKTGNPIRPIVNWKECLVYELAKALNRILHNKLALPNAFNVTHSRKHNELPNTAHTLCLFDIENMYTNIPVK
jgi:hypothetical protein